MLTATGLTTMHKKEIKREVIRQYRSARRALRLFIKKGRQEELHIFRTAVKKLRAIAELIGRTTPGSHKGRLMKPIRKTYKLSGRIRDGHQYIGFGKQAHADADNLAVQEKQTENSTARFKHGKHKHLKRLKETRRMLIKNLKAIDDEQLNLFYEQELRTLAGLFSQMSNDEGLHKARKRLKVLLYTLPLAKHRLKTPVSEDYLEDVQTAIGKWHDMLLAAKIFPALQEKARDFRERVKSETGDFYRRATTPPAPAQEHEIENGKKVKHSR